MSLALTRGLAGYRVRAEASQNRRKIITGDQIGQILIVGLFASMATRLATDAAITRHVTGILLVVSEALVVVLTMIRRPAAAVDRTMTARVLIGLSTFGPLFVRPGTASALAPDPLTVLVSGLGLTLVVIGKLSLGRSFGLAPANRGVVSAGLYRVVRHPIYLGYLVTHVGFAIANAVGWNLLVLAVADAALLLRAVREERTLARDPAYRAYMRRVRSRVLPGVF